MQTTKKGYKQIIESFVKANYGDKEMRSPSWDIDALAATLESRRIHKAGDKDYYQLQHEEGHPVPKTINYTQGGWDYIEAYGKVMGLTLEQAANFLLIGAVTGLLRDGMLGKMVSSMAHAKKTLRKRRK